MHKFEHNNKSPNPNMQSLFLRHLDVDSERELCWHVLTAAAGASTSATQFCFLMDLDRNSREKATISQPMTRAEQSRVNFLKALYHEVRIMLPCFPCLHIRSKGSSWRRAMISLLDMFIVDEMTLPILDSDWKIFLNDMVLEGFFDCVQREAIKILASLALCYRDCKGEYFRGDSLLPYRFWDEAPGKRPGQIYTGSVRSSANQHSQMSTERLLDLWTRSQWVFVRAMLPRIGHSPIYSSHRRLEVFQEMFPLLSTQGHSRTSGQLVPLKNRSHFAFQGLHSRSDDCYSPYGPGRESLRQLYNPEFIASLLEQVVALSQLASLSILRFTDLNNQIAQATRDVRHLVTSLEIMNESLRDLHQSVLTGRNSIIYDTAHESRGICRNQLPVMRDKPKSKSSKWRRSMFTSALSSSPLSRFRPQQLYCSVCCNPPAQSRGGRELQTLQDKLYYMVNIWGYSRSDKVHHPYYNVAAHLRRRQHYNLADVHPREDFPSFGGKHGGKEPPIDTLRNWIRSTKFHFPHTPAYTADTDPDLVMLVLVSILRDCRSRGLMIYLATRNKVPNENDTLLRVPGYLWISTYQELDDPLGPFAAVWMPGTCDGASGSGDCLAKLSYSLSLGSETHLVPNRSGSLEDLKAQ